MLKELLRDNIVKVVFSKKDGSTRVMLCTLIEDFLPETAGSGSYSEEVTTVFDLEKDQWRSFRNDSVISYSIESGK